MEDFNNYRIETNKQLSKLTWFNVGGMSKFYFQPKTFKCLESFLKDNSLNYKIFPLGAGSNILVRDKGFDGIIIHFNELNEISLESDGVISADCGASDAEVARFARNNNRSGLEFLIGIPGTIGGGIKMNSGAYGSDFKSILIDVLAINKNGKLKKFSAYDLNLGYRSNKISNDWIFLKARLKSYNGIKSEIQKKMKQIIHDRKNSQPTGVKTGGSTFMNGKTYKAWEMIDKSNCRGLKFGGAKISEKHCNFIINENNASANDIENLGEIVKKRVFKRTGKLLKWEIKIIGKK